MKTRFLTLLMLSLTLLILAASAVRRCTTSAYRHARTAPSSRPRQHCAGPGRRPERR